MLLKNFNLREILFAIFLLASLTGCHPQGFEALPVQGSLSGDNVANVASKTAQQIFSQYCYSCHDGSQSGVRNFKAMTDRDFVVSGLVIPGDIANSSFLKRVKGSGGNANMPLGSLFFQFSSTEYLVLADWVKNMPPIDITPPIVLSSSPSQPLPANTTATTLTVTTSEAALCRYSSVDGAFDTFIAPNGGDLTASADGLSHSRAFNSLVNGVSYSYFVRCKDKSGNIALTSYSAQFSVQNSSAGPVLSQFQPASDLSSGTQSTVLKLSTDIASTCRYSVTKGLTYDQMGSANTFTSDTSKTAHQISVTGLADGNAYSYFLRCRSLQNQDSSEGLIQFKVTSPVPVLAKDIIKNICSSCHSAWSTYTDADFQASGEVIAGSSATSPLFLRLKYGPNDPNGTGTNSMPPKGSAQEQALTKDDVTIIGQWIDAMTPINLDKTAPVLSNKAPVGSLPTGTTQAVLSFNTNEKAQCRFSVIPGTSFDSMVDNFTADASGTSQTYSLTSLKDGGSYAYFARCIDSSGNKNTVDYTISFSVMALVDTTPPVLSSLMPSSDVPAGASSATLSLVTNEKATCRYSTSAGVSYGQMTNNFSTDSAGLNHTAAVLGLQVGSYTFYVRCMDAFLNSNPTDAIISFGVPQGSGTIVASSIEGIRIGDRFFVKSVFDAIFGPSVAKTTTDMVQNLIGKFGGSCDPMAESNQLCVGVDTSDYNAPIIPASSAPREGQRMKTCNQILTSDTALLYAINQATGKDQNAVTASPIPNATDIAAAYNLFYPGQTPPDSVVTKLGTVATQSNSSSAVLDSWRYLLTTLCWAPDWQAF
ncbi:MAG: hypothetical protein ACXWRZ_17935 [Bdellovibrio sp.]